MTISEPSFTLGIEEEYLLVDLQTFDLVAAPNALMAACKADLGEKVSPEFLRCQIEVGTGVAKTVAEAGTDLAQLRATVKARAAEFGIAPIAASTHPFAKWDQQSFTDKSRYRALETDLAGVARRMLICGMHVHVGVEDDELRARLMGQFRYFLPHLLALSTSSPFWEGTLTGLKSYRLSVFDNMPRTGLPPRFDSFAQYRRTVKAIVASGAIEDATKIWWDFRPSDRYATVESRICDICPRLDDALSLAALTQSLMRMLWRLNSGNLQWRDHDRFLIAENRWRAQRYGISEGLIDFSEGSVRDLGTLVGELIDLARDDAEALGCIDELKSTEKIIEGGTGADRQIAVYEAAMADGAEEGEALRAVVRTLLAEFAQAGRRGPVGVTCG